MTQVTLLGYPRIGTQRELKRALESHWRGELSQDALLSAAKTLREVHWQIQKSSGADIVPTNDFSLYDHMLDTSVLFDAIPDRYRPLFEKNAVAGYFAMARGTQKDGFDLRAQEMTKWFDTNYHYIVPELAPGQKFQLTGTKIFDELKEAQALGLNARPVIPGPITYLKLSKTTDGSNPLDLLDNLLPAYQALLSKLKAAGATWVQLDEPILATDLTSSEKAALKKAYETLASADAPHILLANYFGDFGDALDLVTALPVQGIHADLVRGIKELDALINALSKGDKILSAGIIDGRNVWRSPLKQLLPKVQKAIQALGKDRVWLAPSCSLLHVPMDVTLEEELDASTRSWLSFARQKIEELRILASAADGDADAQKSIEAQTQVLAERQQAPGVVRQDVRDRLAKLTDKDAERDSAYAERRKAQKVAHPLPELPTTTIGSFPQTQDVRKARADFRNGRIDQTAYDDFIAKEIEKTIRIQEKIGLDVLVHGEPERNDMVEYFGEMLDGYIFTRFGWVQSYGSRCVKPPLIYGDVARPQAMTIRWSTYAQSLTDKTVKGMLTGPVTMLKWAFVRNDLPLDVVARQIALALRDEVVDLETNGINVIQIDEPAFKEAQPLRRADWKEYLDWAVESFRISAGGVKDTTEIHTHMCYSEFNDIMDAVAKMDADVISIECSRSKMELLDSFQKSSYPNGIGPGVYDIHSPRVPDEEEMIDLMNRALNVLDHEQVWINPDCGLKTRGWTEVELALTKMVDAAKELRKTLGN